LVIPAGFCPPNGWEAYEQEITNIGTGNNFGYNHIIFYTQPYTIS
jgi:hypothetical protein